MSKIWYWTSDSLCVTNMREKSTDAGRYVAILRKALSQIRNERRPQVCAQYDLCHHEGCRASHEAFEIADQALRAIEKAEHI